MAFLSNFLFGEFLFLSRKREFARSHQIRQASLRDRWAARDWHFTASLISLEIEEYTWTERIQDVPVQSATS